MLFAGEAVAVGVSGAVIAVLFLALALTLYILKRCVNMFCVPGLAFDTSKDLFFLVNKRS
jgi:hypothetical protein